MSRQSGQRIKWTYATHRLCDRPSTVPEVRKRLGSVSGTPRVNDILIAEIAELGRHTKIDYPSGRKCRLFPGDVVGVVFGHRYATRQWRGRVPETLDVCHMLSGGGVCGEVVDMAPIMEPPTILNPLGFLLDERGERVNLRDHGIVARQEPQVRPTILLVVGSGMDSGKTTAAYSIVHGLTCDGATVCAAKLTGTASIKDVLRMHDAGAEHVLDFTDAGHGSTAECSEEDLSDISTNIVNTLSARNPDYVVLEIADGVVQRETEILMRHMQAEGLIDYAVYTCSDTLGIREGIRILRERGLNIVAISGCVACSPLAAQEAQENSDLPVLRPEELQEASVARLFPRRVNRSVIRDSPAVPCFVPPPATRHRVAG